MDGAQDHALVPLLPRHPDRVRRRYQPQYAECGEVLRTADERPALLSVNVSNDCGTRTRDLLRSPELLRPIGRSWWRTTVCRDLLRMDRAHLRPSGAARKRIFAQTFVMLKSKL